MGLSVLDGPAGLPGAETLRWPWALVAVALVVLVLVAWWSRPARRARADAAGAVWLAHLARLRALPRYRSLVRRRRVLGLIGVVGSLVTITGAALVLARPQEIDLQSSDSRSRDIMLCLDASASMDDDNVAVVQAMQQIVGGLPGDRIGLTLWSGAAVSVFPLTDDTDYVAQQLDVAEEAFRTGDDSYFAGVQLSDPRSSLIGDGVVSCAQRFDQPESQRSRAVVVSSDNDPFGGGVYTLPEAARYAAERDVRVYAVAAPVLALPDRAEARTELEDATARTGGLFALVGREGGPTEIVHRIDDLERRAVAEPPRSVRRDDPLPGVRVASAGVGLLVVGWLGAGGLALRDARRRRGRT